MLNTVYNLRVPFYLRLTLAIAAVAASLLVRQGLVRYIGVDLPPFITLYPAVLLVAMMFGFWSGILATLSGILVTRYWILLERGRLASVNAADHAALSIFFCVGIFASLASEFYQQNHRRNETRFRSLFDNMSVGLAKCKVLFDADGHPVDFVYLEVNKAFCDLFGFGNVVGKRATEVDPGITGTPLIEIAGRIALTGKPEGIETEFAPAGKWFATSAYRPEKGYIVAVMEDISERKRSEKRIAHLASFPELNPGYVFETDLEGNPTYFNPSIKMRFPAFDEASVDHPMMTEWPAIITSLKENPEQIITREVAVDDLTLLQTICYIPDFGVVRTYSVDITHLKQAEAEKARLEEHLQESQRLEAIGQLAGGIAHDFNNLLMVIMAQTELLSMNLKGTALERTESIMHSAQRAAAMTGELLAFSRKQTIQPQVMSLNQVVQGVPEMLHRLVKEDIDVRFALCDQPWMVEIDKLQFERVLMNLAVNARDAMPEGGVLTVETHNCELNEEQLANHPLVPPGRYALLAVSDTGLGMTAETKARVFDPFFTTKAQGKGTGLGLSMIYGIVKQSNGFIWVYSEVGHGTCFKIFIPVVSKTQLVTEADSTSGDVQERRIATILLVEDSDDLRDVIEAFLQSGGHTVIAADSPVEACRLALEQRAEIDLLLTDVVLKEGNGRQLAQRLKSQGCEFPVVYMSGYTPNAIVHHGVLDPGMLFLQKPFSRATLLDMIEKALSLNS